MRQYNAEAAIMSAFVSLSKMKEMSKLVVYKGASREILVGSLCLSFSTDWRSIVVVVGLCEKTSNFPVLLRLRLR